MISQDVSDAVANSVLSLFQSLPSSGKPVGKQFTVLAGIVARIGGHRNHVICLTTGTKCLSNYSLSCEVGATISDSHAEVTARRCFIRYLLLTALHIKTDPHYSEHEFCPLIFREETKKLGLKPGWEFWLYVSDSPCGEASVYERSLGRSFSGKKSRLVKENSAERAEWFDVRGDNESLSCAEDNGAQSSMLRTKPGRVDMGDAVASSSMSCCDKIVRWMYLGLQGGLLSGLLEKDIYLTGIVVGEDPLSLPGAQLDKLHCTLTHRYRKFMLQKQSSGDSSECDSDSDYPDPAEIFITPHQFSFGKCYSEAVAVEEGEGEEEEKNTSRPHSRKRSHPSGSGSGVSSGSCSMSDNKQMVQTASVSAPRLKSSGANLSWLVDVPCTLAIDGSLSAKCDTTNKKKQAFGGTVEVTISATGRPQGYVPPKHLPASSKTEVTSETHQRLLKSPKRIESRICRRSIAELYIQLTSAVNAELSTDVEKKAFSYFDCKRHHVHDKYRKKRKIFLSSSMFRTWIVDDSNITEQFSV